MGDPTINLMAADPQRPQFMDNKSKILKQEALTLVSDILASTAEGNSGPIGPLVKNFRVRHKDKRKILDALEQEGWITRESERYRLRIATLPAIPAPAASGVFQMCSKVYKLVRKAYEKDPNNQIFIKELSARLAKTRAETIAVITYLSDLAIWGSRTTDLNATDAYLHASEAVLDHDTLESAIRSLRLWRGKHPFRWEFGDDATSDRPQSKGTITSPLDVTIAAKALSDAPTSRAHDALGYGVYADAIVDFLTDPQTQPPFSLAVAGPWGSGKTTLLRWIRAGLFQKVGDCPTVWFSPWKYNEHDEVWAAFARTITQTLLDTPFKRAHLRVRRFVDTLPSRAILVSLGLVAAAAALIAICAWVGTIELGVVATYVIASIALTFLISPYLAPVWHAVKSPLLKLLARSKGPDYERALGFQKEFEEDLGRLLRMVTGPVKPLFVFIDDLDRAPPPVPARLLEAMNLLIGQERCIFVVGLDLDMVAASIEARYLPIIQRLEEVGDSTTRFSGKSFVEKLFQLEFALPTITEYQVDEFLDSILVPTRIDGSREIGPVEGDRVVIAARRPEGRQDQSDRSEVTANVFPESEDFAATVRRYSVCLPRNPRKIKRFINCFRLLAYIAARRDLFAGGRVKLDYLGAMTVLTVEFPELLKLMPRVDAKIVFARILGELQDPAIPRWSDIAEREHLSSDVDRYRSLESVVEVVLHILENNFLYDYLSLSEVVSTT